MNNDKKTAEDIIESLIFGYKKISLFNNKSYSFGKTAEPYIVKKAAKTINLEYNLGPLAAIDFNVNIKGSSQESIKERSLNGLSEKQNQEQSQLPPAPWQGTPNHPLVSKERG